MYIMYKYYYIDCVVGGDKTGIINLKNLGRHKQGTREREIRFLSHAF